MSIFSTGTPAERMIGLSFSSDFSSNQAVTRDGGVVTGNPVISNGSATLDGTNDYITYTLDGNEFNSANLSIEMDFYPDFDTDNDAITTMVDTTDGKIAFSKLANVGSNALRITLDGGIIADIAEGVYSPYWNVGARNVLLISGTDGNTSAWLNGNNILDEDSTAWSVAKITNLYIGATRVGSNFFDGKITKFQVFKSLLTAQDATNFYNNSTYNYQNQSVFHLPCGAAQHDATNTRTLDVSRNANPADFGAGAAEPTKLQGRGYSTDGGDYMSTGTNLFTETGKISFTTALKLPVIGANSAFAAYEKNDNSDVGMLLFYDTATTEIRFYTGGVSVNNAATFDFDSEEIVTIVGVHDGTNTCIYVNGVAGTNAPTPLAPDVTADMLFSVFARGNLSTSPTVSGTEIYECQMYDIGLTPLQSADAHIRMLNQINDI